MKTSRKAPARLLAVIALVGAVVVLVAVLSSLPADSGSSGSQQGNKHSGSHRHRTKAKSYVVESGDTLVAIAHKTGIPVAEIIALNPEIDPQILIAGEKLKLK